MAEERLPPLYIASPEGQCGAALQVLRRTLREQRLQVVFEVRDEAGAGVGSWFELEARDGLLHVAGSSAVELCRGVYHYLREIGAGMVAWSGSSIRVPDPLPAFGRTRLECPYQIRHYMNVVTFGYTTVYWDWARWEQEIDWMALHGINMPLAHVGQESIWRKVWQQYGVTEAELDAHFTGPAHLPWNRMGNINGHEGPPPTSWHIRQAELQKKILQRMRDLGMMPVVPAFAGIVPAALRDRLGADQVLAIEPWAGFSTECRTYLLSPHSPEFGVISRLFIEEYAWEFGRCQYYLADSLNELELPELQKNSGEFAAALGRVTAKSIHDTDPNGVWMMQGWLFHYNPRVWTPKAVKAFLASVPDERVIVIDLCNELFAGWRKLKAFYGKQWLYGVVHNFGGNNPPNGDLEFYARDAARMLASPRRGRMLGFAICPEGIENNELVYELLTDVAWQAKRVPVGVWLRQYCVSRYGKCPARMRAAWKSLLPSVYHRFHITVRHGFQRRPSLRPVGRVDVKPEAREGLELFLACAKDLRGNRFYLQDAVELVVHYLGSQVDVRLRNAGRAQQAGMPEFRDRCIEDALEIMVGMDSLLTIHPIARLERWLEFATRSGSTPEEACYYVQNAKRLITTWGGPALSEYGSKVWCGLIRDYYVGRWRVYHEALKMGEDADLERWEEEWIQSEQVIAPSPKVTDPIGECWRLIKLADSWERHDFQLNDEGDIIGSWSAEAAGAVLLQWNVSQFLLEPGRYEVVFRSDNELRGAAEIKHVRLLENGVEVARDRTKGHLKEVAAKYAANLRVLMVKPGTDYVVSARMTGEAGSASSGTVWLKPVIVH